MHPQSGTGQATFKHRCSQCATMLGPHYPISSNMCNACFNSRRGCYQPEGEPAIRNRDKGNPGQRSSPIKISSLSNPSAVEPSRDGQALENAKQIDLSNFLLPTSIDYTENDDNPLPEMLELSYVEEHPTENSTPAESLLPKHTATLARAGESRLPPIDLRASSQKSVHLHEPPPSGQYFKSIQGTATIVGGQPSQPLWTTQFLKIPSKPTHIVALPGPIQVLRVCATHGCTAIVPPYSTCSRCVRCIKSEWKTRQARLSLRKSSFIMTPGSTRKGKRKSVTWADQQSGASHRHNSSDQGKVSDPTSHWSSKIKRVRLILPQPPGALPTCTDNLLTEVVQRHGHTVLHSPMPNKAQKQTKSLETLLDSLLGDSDLSELTDTSSEDSDFTSYESTDSTGSPEQRTITPKFTIRIPARTPVDAPCSAPLTSIPNTAFIQKIPYNRCSAPHCGRFLRPTRDRDTCIWCRTNEKQLEQKARQEIKRQILTNVDKNDKSRLNAVDFPPTLLPVKELINQELLSGDVVPGARICASASCHHVIPALAEYPFHMCLPCRTEDSRKPKAKGTRADSTILDEEISAEPWIVKMGAVSPSDRCRSRDCGILVNGFSECWQCTSRSLGYKGQRGETRGSGLTADSELPYKVSRGIASDISTCSGKESTRPSFIVTPYPEYKCQQDLLTDFYMRFSGFIQLQNIYSRRKKTHATHGSPKMEVFGFDGQFSVVALDFDLMSRRDAIEISVLKLKAELARLGTLYFNPNRCVTINECGIFTRFICAYRVHNSDCPPPFPPPAQEAKLAQGELEVAVLPDHSHRFIPGQKVVVRFRMVI